MVRILDSQEHKINALVFKKFFNVSLEDLNGVSKAVALAKINAFEERKDSEEKRETYEPKLAYDYKQELWKLPLEELEKLYQSQAKEIDALLNEEIKQKEAELFDQDNMRADYEYWNKADFWSVEECLILTLKKDPRRVGHDYISNNRHYQIRFSGECYSEFTKKYDEIFGLIQRSIDSGLLKTLPSVSGKIVNLEKRGIVPINYINWAKDKNITLPEELSKITENKNDNEALLNQALQEINALKEENKSLKEENSSLKEAMKQKEDQRVIRTLYKILCGIIKKHYGKNETSRVSIIQKILLSEAGIELSEKSLRTHIEKALEEDSSEKE